MDKLKSVGNDLKNNISNATEQANKNLETGAGNLNKNFNNKIMKIAPMGAENILKGSKEFLNTNSTVGKGVFLFLIIFIFIGLFGILTRIIYWLMSPSETPYILWGMKSGNSPMTISQAYAEKNSIPLFRSKNENDGIEFSYAFWMYVESNIGNSNNDTYQHIFHKGSVTKTDENARKEGLFAHNNAPGVYLYTGKDDALNDAYGLNIDVDDRYRILSLLVRMNVYNNSKDLRTPYKYYEDVRIEGIPIKKWIHVVIRSTSQKILDVYLNGKVVKRVRLSNVIKQNYDDLHINLNGGFDGFLSNIKYWNHAIGTFEIDNMVNAGPNLKMSKEDSLNKSKPDYLSNKWYFNESKVNY
jgi:hypothetical protein